jgi:ribosomal protein S18 acetylase RimI-like enzyme
MELVNHQEYEWNVQIRQLRIDDFDALIEMQQTCFPGIPTWTREQIESQLSIFPEGQIVIEIDGKLAASSNSLILQYDRDMAWHDWKRISDGGMITTHSPKGEILYGIEIMVSPEFRGMKLSRRLYEARKQLCRDHNIERIIVGGRIPGYSQHAASLSASEYVERVITKALYDPVLTAQISNGFALQGLIPNYLPTDDDSCGYATFLEWRNLDYQRGSKRRHHRPVEQVRIAVVQYQLRKIANFEEFTQQCEFFVDVASDYKCDFIMFPELFTTQLLSCVEPTRPGLAARRLAEFTPDYLEFFAECFALRG